MLHQTPRHRASCAKNRAADITSLFSSLQDSVSAGILPLNTKRMRTNMRNYSSPFSSTSSSSSAASTPGLDESTSTSRPSNTGQIYSNWVFVTSAEVLARAGEGEDDEGGGEGYHDHVEGGEGTGGEGSGGGSTTTGATPGGGWTKRQYREESEKLRGKEWVFR